MRKKSFLLFVILCCITLLVACVFVACNPDNKNQGDIGEKIEFTLTFDVDGAAYAKIQTAGNEIITLPDNPIKDGYVFDGWYWDKNVWSQPFTVMSLANQPLASDMTVYAKWITEEESRIGVVNFVTNGGSVVSPIRTSILEISPVTVRSGYILEGWYTTATLDDDTKVSFPLQVSGDMCLYAKWNIVEYSIRYVTSGGRLPSETPYEYTIETQTVLPVPDREGYTFVGWYENEDFSGPQTAVITVGQIGEKTFYARWQINEYTISFDSMGGSAVSSVSGDYGIPVAAPVSPVKNGYDFVGWFTDRTLVEEFVFETMPAEDITLYAKWNAVEYDLTYHTSDGLMPDDAQHKYTIEDEFTLPIPHKNNYTFVGWFENADLQGSPVVSIDKGNTGNKEFWAKWDATAYSITYHLDGGINDNNPPSYNTEDETLILAAPRKTGYSFVGWYDNSAFAGEAVTKIESGSSGNKEFWAKWQINQYTITFDTNGGSEIESCTQDYASIVTAPADPTRTGYTFGGWFADKEFGEDYTFTTMPAENITVFAKWEIITYSITYNPNGADISDDVVLSYTIEDEKILLPELVKIGYSFIGWYDNAEFDGEVITEIAAGSSGNIELWAKWQINQYTITFDTNGGSEIESCTQDYASIVTAPADPTRTGYTFGGWFADKEFGEDYTFTTMPAENITVFAKWIPITYDIDYNIEEGIIPEDAVTKYTIEDAVTLPILVKEGYTFSGWYDNEQYDGEPITEIKLGTTGDKEYYGKFIINRYTVTFNTQGGSEISSVTQDYGTVLLQPEAPVKNGYVFAGWYADADYLEKFEFNITLTKDLTIFAKWEAIEYAIHYYNVDDAVHTNPTSYTVEDEFILSAPIRNGYSFDFWYLNGDTGSRITQIERGSTGELFIYASWIKADNGYAIISAPNYAFISDTELKTVIENDVTEFDFRGTFTVSPNAGWRVFTEENCSQPSELTLRTATDLQEGDNYYYVLVENNSTYQSEVYTINVYRKHLYTVNFYNKEGDLSDSFTHLEGKAITDEMIDESFNLTDKGYELFGWYFDADFSEEYALGSAINKNQKVINLYSKYQPIVYHITYVMNGGTNAEENSVEYTVESESVTLVDPTRDAWTFEGWWLEDTYQTQVHSISPSDLKEYVLYAKWVPFTVAENEEGGLTIIGYAQNDKAAVIPSSINGKSVTAIGEGAFSGSDILQSVILPDSVTKIEVNAFKDCIYLKTIDLNGVKEIGNYAFSGCTGLTSVVIPDSVTSIEANAFYNCTGLTSVTIGNNVTSIGNCAFYGCTGLTEIIWNAIAINDFSSSSDVFFGAGTAGDGITVTFGDGVQTIPAYVFYSCKSLASVTIYDTVTRIGAKAFDDCTNIKEAIMPTLAISYIPKNSLQTVVLTSGESIGSYAFNGCSGLTSIVIPDSVTGIGFSAFYGCSNLTSIYYTGDIVGWCGISGLDNIMSSERGLYINGSKLEGEVILPGGVKSIPPYAFAYQTGFTSITIPDSVTSIGDSAFYGCTGLTSITIPDSVTNIGDSVFYGCTGLASITIPDSVTSIGDSAFYGCTGLTSITIPDSVTSMGDSAFYGCTGLTSVIIPDSVTGIGAFAFYDCTGLVFVTIGDSVISIGASAFYGCTGLTSVTISNSVTTIGSRVFYGCTGLTSVIIPDSVTSLGTSAFWDCAGLTSVTIGNSVTSIGDYTFYGCTGLTSITIPGSVTSIGDCAFDGCTGLASVTIGNSVASIGKWAFSDCIGLTSITIPDSVTTIGSSAFDGCTGLTSVTIGDSVTSIGDSVFYGCTGLTFVTIGNSVTSVGSYAFEECVELTSITIPYGVTSIGTKAFYGCYKLVEVYNKSSLTITVGSSSNGYIGYYAKNVYTEEDGSWFTDTKDGYRFLYDGMHGYLIGYYGDQTELILPDSFTAYNGTEITEYAIYDYAFYGCMGLTSITIPDSVTSIGDYAFYGCTGLTEIIWNAIAVNDFTSSNNVFYNAGTAGDGITVIFGDNIQKIPAHLFDCYNSSYAPNIKSVIIGNGVTIIGDSAFDGCTGLTEIIWNAIAVNNFTYSNNVFLGAGTAGDGITVIFGDGVQKIPAYAFQACMGLTSITIPDSVTSIGDYAFYGCTGLTEIIWNAIAVNNFTYSNNVFLGAGTAGDGITVIFGDGVQKIPAYAFYRCGGLTSITIPDSVTSIGYNAFEDCTGLRSIYYTGDIVSWLEKNWHSNIMSSGRVLYINGSNLEGEDIVPNGVMNIPSYAFAYQTSLTSITIPDSVTSIGDSVFYGCTGLTSVTIGNSVTSIGDNAFYDCTGLKELIWDAVAVNDFTSGSNVFYNAGTAGDGITVAFGDNVQNIPAYAFYDCSGLTSITIPDSVTSIGKGAFDGTAWYEEQPDGIVYVGKLVYVYKGTMLSGTTIHLKEGTLGVGDYAFRYCTGLTSITIPDSVTSIGDYAFANCTGLTSITIPDSVTSIGDYAFAYCTGLTLITISNSITSIGDLVFSGCTNITEAMMPTLAISYIPKNSLRTVVLTNGESIGAYAFDGYTELTSITIPDSVTSIGDYAFRYCTRLTEIKWNAIAVNDFSSSNNVFYNAGTAGDGITVIFGDGVQKIPAYLFYVNNSLYRPNIKNVIIGDNVTSIGANAFEGCTGLTSVIIPDSVTSIGANAFEDCTGLTSVIISDSVTSIGDFAFFGCSGLTSITIPDSVTSIGGSAFNNCAGLESIYYAGDIVSWLEKNWHSNIMSSGRVLYINNSKIEGEVIIPNGVNNIPSYAFVYQTSLTSVTIPDSVTSIGGSAFNNCAGLESIYYAGDIVSWLEKNWHSNIMSSGRALYIDGSKVEGAIVIPDGVETVPSYAFEYQTGITSVTIPDSVTSIGNGAFEGCTGLTCITIPNSVTSIGGSAFGLCTGLTSITIPDSVTSIEANAFYNCTGLTSIIIPDSVTNIGGAAFWGCTGLTSVIFENTNGWQIAISDSFDIYVSLSSSDLSSSSTAATYLVVNYCGYYWRRV